MAKATTKTEAMALQERIRSNMFSYVSVENKALIIGKDRKALAEERVAIVLDYAGKHSDMMADLRVELVAFPTGSDELKARKQSWKRSFSKAFHKVYSDLELTFTADRPMVKPAEVVVSKSWQEKLTDLMTEHGASDTLITATIATMEKEIASERARIDKAKADNDTRLKRETAAKVDELKKELARLEKTATA